LFVNAVIVALPALTPVIFPVLSTETTGLLLDAHVSFAVEPSDVIGTARSVAVAPFFMYTVVCATRMDVTGFTTVTAHLAVFLPSLVVTVIVAVPTFTAVTLPFESTVAISVLLLFQVTALFVASAGETVATSVAVCLVSSLSVVSDKETEVTRTFTGPPVTVTSQNAVLLPSTVVTVMVAVPASIAATIPDALTIATASLLLLHVTLLFVALAGITVAVNAAVFPFTNAIVLGDSVTPVTGTVVLPPPVTVTAQVAVLPPSAVVAVIVAEPAPTPVTTPDALTTATALLLLVQDTVLFVALAGSTVAYIVED